MIRLRELSREDVPFVNRWRQDRDVADLLVGSFRHVSLVADEAWFDSYAQNRKTNVRLAIVTVDENRLIGVTYLLNISDINRSAEFGMMIGEKDYWGKGLGSAACRMTVSHAFEDLNLNRLELLVLEKNVRAMAVYRKTGFAQEGVLRQAAYKCGQYRDLILMGLTRDQYLSHSELT